MRSNGRRRHQSEFRLREAVRGELYFGPTPLDDYGPRMQARLLDQAGADLLAPLQFAKIARIEGVMHITGIEYYLRGRKGSPTRHRQSWLCAAHQSDALRMVERLNVPSITGFIDDEFINDPPVELDPL